MNVNNVTLTISAVRPDQYPTDNRIEIAFVGRSNVGKSSLINALINRKSFARTSSEPGKTRLINFYNIEEKIYFVDLPGYGYAKVSKAEKTKWANMIENYLKTREQLTAVLLLIDIRHEPTADDKTMYDWLKHFEHNVIVVCTKADKISRNEANKNLQKIKTILKLNEEDKILAFSSETKHGKEELWKIIDEFNEDNEDI